ncbi:hypothetical protein BOTBODRAFT_32503 [Botryobasidium botryosum FD-172 SS1]|uniref:Methyltransferase small domain-containing protein n=1 Tax=Botryobasidium botryosum (strain FD-172 SS1) TaxID=930990 RepID=A0A067MGU7_BOTB1|nr:hypothetical protein BOTBODRAFT_32503 [Botryobasidium botryosum FD-172 SS1]
MLPTPDLSHLTQKDYEHVYEPAEDTFILLDALEKDAGVLQELKPRLCLEVGSGSGCVSAFLGKILGKADALYLCTDINLHATQSTLKTGEQNDVPLNPVLASLTRPLTARLHHAVDILIFNPPYVPTTTIEAVGAQAGRDIQGSWAGGNDGMQVTNELLESVESLLSPQGLFYLVAVKQNNIPKISHHMLERYGLISEVVLQRRAGREHLHILKFMHLWHDSHLLRVV